MACGRGHVGVVGELVVAVFSAPDEEGDDHGDEEEAAERGADADSGFRARGESPRRTGRRASPSCGGAGADYAYRYAGGVSCDGGGGGHEVVLPEDAAPGEGGQACVGWKGRDAGVEDVGRLAVGRAAGHGELYELGRVVVHHAARPVCNVSAGAVAVEVLACLVDGYPFLVVERRRLVQAVG